MSKLPGGTLNDWEPVTPPGPDTLLDPLIPARACRLPGRIFPLRRPPVRGSGCGNHQESRDFPDLWALGRGRDRHGGLTLHPVEVQGAGQSPDQGGRLWIGAGSGQSPARCRPAMASPYRVSHGSTSATVLQWGPTTEAYPPVATTTTSGRSHSARIRSTIPSTASTTP